MTETHGAEQLANLCDVCSSKRVYAHELVPTGVPFWRTTDIVDRLAGRESSNPLFISEEKFQQILLQSGAPVQGDVLLTSRGTLGLPYQVKEGDRFHFADGNLSWFRNFCGITGTYLYYFLQSPGGRAELSKCVIGSSQQAYTLASLKQIKVPCLPLEDQRRIADILSAYDDLIENCQRRIKILEEMARSLYREWFIEFRYPGFEDEPLAESQMGMIPKGWQVETIKSTCDLVMGQSPKSEFYNLDGFGMPFHQGVTDFGGRHPKDRLFCTTEGRMATAGDILFSVRAPVGRLNIANKSIILGRGLSAIRHRRNYQALLWEQLSTIFTKVDMIGNGSIFASVTRADLEAVEILQARDDVMERATNFLEPIHRAISLLYAECENLRQTRDLLLPKLLSP